MYGLIRAAEDLDFGPIGLEQDGAPAAVRTIRVGDIAAVVSECKPGGRILPIRKNLDAHHKTIREVMKERTIVPMTFGHVAECEADIAKTIKQNRDAILAELKRLDHRVEMGLRVRWDVENIFEYFVRENANLASYRDQVFGQSSPPSQAEKIELGRIFEDLVSRERERLSEQVLEILGPCSADVRALPAKNDKIVMDLAFLVDRDKLQAFEGKVYQAANAFPAQFVFDYNGPWAPFNFIELDLDAAA